MYARSVTGVVVAIIVAIVMFVSKSSDKSKDEKNIRYEMKEYIAASPAYKLDRDYIEVIFPEAHSTAFAEHYRLGGRYRSNRFDQDGYVDEVFGVMIDRAKAEKRDKVADELQKLWQSGPPIRLIRK